MGFCSADPRTGASASDATGGCTPEEVLGDPPRFIAPVVAMGGNEGEEEVLDEDGFNPQNGVGG